jgi:8-oxo-dGTP pyrophosphatase MutT (NUDIX family)
MYASTQLQQLAASIKARAAEELPGIKAHQAMLPEGRSMPDDYLNKIQNYKKSAVFALLFEEEEGINLLLTQRHEYEGKHSGQISFPGGKMEAIDTDLLHTAYRETQEEVGISKTQIELITALSPLYIPVSNFYVQPYLGYLQQSLSFTINAREVKNIIKFPVQQINNPAIQKIKKIAASSGFTLSVPAFEIDEYTVWGATAMMLKEIGELIKYQ